MLLRRIGNKTKLLPKLYPLFPEHDVYIEMFFGSGSVFFNKFPVSQYNILNDLDNDVYNCFVVLQRHKQELVDYINSIPYHREFLNEARYRTPDNDIEKAAYFLFVSNYTLYGKGDTLKFGTENAQAILLKNLEQTYKFLVNVNTKFTNVDFREVLGKIQKRRMSKTFIYCDPPYLNTVDNYSNSFKKQDVIDLMDLLKESGYMFAYSEFDNEFIVDEAKKRGFDIKYIGERQSLKNRSTEILIVNYEVNNDLFGVGDG